MSSDKSAYVWKGETLELQIQLQPRASRTEWCGWQAGRIKLRISAAPVDQQANKECIQFLSKSLKTPKSNVRITKGQNSRLKTIEIEQANKERWQEIIAHFND